MQFLPEAFKSSMKNLLSSSEYEQFIAGYSDPPFKGIRINTIKYPLEFADKLPFELKPSPFAADSFYIISQEEKTGISAYHHAGAIYAQEPSASVAATLLGVQKDENVLDMCASPGGKTAQIAAALGGTGMLWSNEYVAARTGALISNIERLGIKNAVVSSLRPDALPEYLFNFFDRIIVDAPCSGEGMFRKNPDAARQWSPEHSESCAVRQLEILNTAAKYLKPGGIMVYSTCTFSYCENEGVIEKFLAQNADFYADNAALPCAHCAPVCSGTAVRIYPCDGGEGHFAARLIKKDGGEASALPPFDGKLIKNPFEDILNGDCGLKFTAIGENIYALPAHFAKISGSGILRAGILAGKIKKQRIEPCHALFTALAPECFKNTVDLTNAPVLLAAYLRGEEIEAKAELKGYTAVIFDGMTLGFGKCSGGRLKNHYPKGLRNLK